MIEERARIDQIVTESFSRMDSFRVQKSNNEDPSTLKYYLSYRRLDNVQDRIKFNALQKEEIFGQKIKALMERTKARDLYDAYHLVKRMEDNPGFLNRDLLRKTFIYYVCCATHDLRMMKSDRIDVVEDSDIEQNLHPVLKTDDVFDLPSVKSRVYPFLDEMLTLAGSEIDFADAFFGRAEYHPELLFGPPYATLSHGVANSPSIMWKLQNLREHLGINDQ